MTQALLDPIARGFEKVDIRIVLWVVTALGLESQGLYQMVSIWEGLFAAGFGLQEAVDLALNIKGYMSSLRIRVLEDAKRGAEPATLPLQDGSNRGSEPRREEIPECAGCMRGGKEESIWKKVKILKAFKKRVGETRNGCSRRCRVDRYARRAVQNVARQQRGALKADLFSLMTRAGALDCSVSQGTVLWEDRVDVKVVADLVANHADVEHTATSSLPGVTNVQFPLLRVFLRCSRLRESMPYHLEGLHVEFEKSRVYMGDAPYHLDELVNAQQSSEDCWNNSLHHAASLCEEYLKSDFVSAKAAYHLAAVCYDFMASRSRSRESAEHLAFLREKCLSRSDCLVSSVNAGDFIKHWCKEGRLVRFFERSSADDESSSWGDSDSDSDCEESESIEIKPCAFPSWSDFYRHLAQRKDLYRQFRLNGKAIWRNEVYCCRHDTPTAQEVNRIGSEESSDASENEEDSYASEYEEDSYASEYEEGSNASENEEGSSARGSGARNDASGSGARNNARGSGARNDASGSGARNNASGSGARNNASGSGARNNASGSGARNNASGSGARNNASGSGARNDASGSGARNDARGSGGRNNASSSGARNNASGSGARNNASGTGARNNASSSGARNDASGSGARNDASVSGARDEGSQGTRRSEGERHVGADHAEAEGDAADFDDSPSANSHQQRPEAEAVADIVRHVGASERASRSVFAWQEGTASDSAVEVADFAFSPQPLNLSELSSFKSLFARCEAEIAASHFLNSFLLEHCSFTLPMHKADAYSRTFVFSASLFKAGSLISPAIHFGHPINED